MADLVIPHALPGRRGQARTHDLPYPVAHADLKSIAEHEDKLLQDLLKEDVNLVLQRYGKKPIA